jgi:lipopolysaccharide export system permease protein
MFYTRYRYIVKELFTPFVMGVVIFTFILIMFQLLKFIEFLVVNGVSFWKVFLLIYYLVVAFLPITVPVSFLFSVLLVFSRLSSDNEILAFKASGISIYKLMTPVFSVSMLAALITFYVSFYGGPWGNRNFENSLHQIGAAKATIQIKEGFFNENFLKDFVLYAGVVVPDSNVMENVFVFDERDKDNPLTVSAKKSQLKIDAITRRTELLLSNGFITFLKNTGQKYRRAKFDEYNIVLFEGAIVGDRAPNLPSMSFGELRYNVEMAKKDGNISEYNKSVVESHRRIAIPFACLIFGFLGVVFGNTNSRNMQTGAGFLSFIVMVIYWLIYITATSLGSKGAINPVLSAWLANIFFAFFGCYLFFKKD